MTTIFWAGDSTVTQNTIATYPQTGIGQAFERFVKPGRVVIANYAQNGRSTKSFLEEGLLAAMEPEMQAGDFLFIQFGHNDEKQEDPARYADPEVDFPANLKIFADAARAKGAIPVIITPLTRLKRNGPQAKYHHDRWAESCRKTAAQLGVALVDLTRLSEDLVDATGEAAAKWYMNIPAGKYPAFPDGLTDGTHLQPEGAQTFAALIAQELRDLGSPYADLLFDDYDLWQRQDAAHLRRLSQEGADERR